jgi:hypothetical protein
LRSRRPSLSVAIAFLLLSYALSAPLLAQETNWEIETIDADGSVGKYASIDLSVHGFPHVAYRDEDQRKLKYAWSDAGCWHFVLPDTASDSGMYASLALDSSNHPHVSHMVSWGNLAYASQDDTGWKEELVDTWGDYSSMTSLALGIDGSVHIAYCFQYSDDLASYAELKYAFRNEGDWDIDTIEQGEDALICPSLAVDGSGRVHLAYSSLLTHTLNYACLDGSAWSIETVSSNPAWNISLVLDSANHPHIAYSDGWYPNSGIKYARKPEDEWHIQSVAATSAQSVSLQLDGNDRPHIAYGKYRTTNDEYELCYAKNVSDWWQLETIDNEGSVGQYASMVFDDQYLAHIVYYDATNSNLKYAHAVALSSDKATDPVVSTIRLQLESQNPCHGTARLALQVPSAVGIVVAVYDMSGRRISMLADRIYSAGRHLIRWDGRGDLGELALNGPYIISAEAGGQRVSKRIVLLR